MGNLFRSVSVLGVLALSCCAQASPPPIAQTSGLPPLRPPYAAPTQVVLRPPAEWSEAAISADAARFRAALFREVPHHLIWTGARAQAWITAARAEIASSDQVIEMPQLVVVVDRNPAVQALEIMLARPSGHWTVLGGGRVSTGQARRKDYYYTPTGVFAHTDGILDFRAAGTFNQNHIRGLGTAGMRVWDFGWQWAIKGWLPGDQGGDIRLQMHATDPEYLEQRLGRPASEGCVRVSSAMNRFLDRHGVLDVDYERAAATDISYRALLGPDRDPTQLAGRLLVVIDSRDPPGTPPTRASRPVDLEAQAYQ